MHKPLKALLATSAILFAACTTPTGSSTPTGGTTASNQASVAPTTAPVDITNTTYNPDPGTKGGQVLIGDWQEANQFNPFYAGQVSEANVASAAFASLTIATNDYKYAPDLADSIPTTANGGVKVPGDNGDKMTVTWKLKADEKWSDGTPLTCDDFEATRVWIMDPANTGLAGGTTGWEDLSKIECPDATTSVWHFKNIYEAYITLGTPLSKAFLGKHTVADMVKGAGFRAEEVKNLPVSGAFKFDSVTPGQELVMVRNDNYKGFKLNKVANLDKIKFHWYGDADAMIAGFAAGEVDFATDLQDSDIPKLEQQGLHANISAAPALLYEFLRPNWADGSKEDATTGVGGCSKNPAVQDRGKGCPMSDPAMRQAVAYAIDKNEINTKLLGGNAQVANTNISPQAWYYSDQPPASFAPDKAKAALDAAGWKDTDGDGVREKNGVKAKIELCTTTRQVRQDTLALIVNWLKDVGIEGVPNPVAPADIFVEFNDGTKDTACGLSHSNFDLAEHAFSQSLDPIGNYTSYHSSQFEPKGSNDAQVSDPDIDKSLETVKNSVDFGVIKDAMATFQKIYVEKTIEIPLYYRKNVDLVGSKLGNYFSNPTLAGPTWNVFDWYLKG